MAELLGECGDQFVDYFFFQTAIFGSANVVALFLKIVHLFSRQNEAKAPLRKPCILLCRLRIQIQNFSGEFLKPFR